MLKEISIILVLIISSIPCTSRTMTVQDNNGEIAFLDIVMTDTSIDIVNMTIRPGVLKEYHWFEKEGILYVVVSVAGDTLWKGMLDNPLVQQLEYLDEEEHFQWMSEHVERAEFTIRIPYSEDVDHILFNDVRISLSDHQKFQYHRNLIRKINLKHVGLNRGARR